MSNAIALLGGTFNPPHLGHIQPALEVTELLNVAQLGLMPCKLPPHKSTNGIDETHRVAMTQLMCALDPRLYVETIELSLPSPSYTVKTLRELRRRNPKTRIHFLIGDDSLYNLPTWYEWQALLDYCHLVVMKRDTGPLKPDPALHSWLSQHRVDHVSQLAASSHGHVFLANTTLTTVSSTEIRQTIAQHNVQHLTSHANGIIDSVADYIRRHHLYGSNTD